MRALRAPVLLVSLLFLLLEPGVSVGKEKLRWLGFNEGIAEAQKTGKKVLIDVYTDWCVWCKRMEASTYSNDGVASYLARHYVLIRLNAESASRVQYKGTSYSEQDLARAFGVTGYPTTIFLKPNGEPITGMPGYAEAGRFMDVIAFIGEDHYLKQKFDEYVAGKSKK